MKTIRRFAIASVALALGLPAVAQNADTSATAPSGQRFSATPSRTVHNNNGSAKAVLAPYGPYITQTGVGAAGADVSEIEPGFNTFGFGMQGGTINNRLADDFVLGSAATVSNYKWLTYQTGAATSGTISGMNLNLWSTDPLLGGAAAFTGPANSLTSQSWTGVYRVTSTTLLAINRAIIEVDNSAAWASALPAGTYWLDATATGLISSGPWGPVVVPATAADNGRQFLGSSATWIAVTDGVALLPQGFLFQVEGTGGGGPPTFCTSTPSSLAGCTSSLSGTGTSVSKSGGAGSYTLSAAPAPGGNQAGIFLWAKSQITPVLAPFGWRCIPVTRGKPDLPGGTPNVCNGQYDWDVGGYVNTTAGIVVGDNLSFQGWYRDPGLAVGALFTDGVGPIAVVP
jgi:hypothetical protein